MNTKTAMQKSVPAAVFLAALALYLITLSPMAAPGESARFMVQHLGLDPFPPTTHHVWGAVARLVDRLPGVPVSRALNLFSALCGALSALLVFLITSGIERNRSLEEVTGRFNDAYIRAFSGLVAAVLFATCMPGWVIGTRAHPVSFDTVLLLFAIFTLMRFGATRRLGYAYASVVTYSLGLIESGTFILLWPVWALWLAYSLYAAERFTLRVVLRMALVAVVSICPYFVAAFAYMRSPAYEWREFHGYVELMRIMLRDQLSMVKAGVPKVGWLTVLLVSAVPWLAVVGFKLPGRVVSTRGVWLGNYLLYLLLTGLGLLMIFNHTLSPWRVTGGRSPMVTPYFFIAMWFGYLAGYWLVALGGLRRRRSRSSAVIRMLQGLCAALLLSALIWGAVRNLPRADGRRGRPLVETARRLVASLDGRSWVVGNGVLDDLITLEAHQQGLRIHMVNVGLGRTKSYLRYVASLFEEPRLKSLALVGLGPLLNEWLSSDDKTPQTVAIIGTPDLWLGAGYTWEPRLAMFLGSPLKVAGSDPEQLLRAHQDFWNNIRGDLIRDVTTPSVVLPWMNWLQSHLGKVANNLGVYFEDQGRNDLAREAYRSARQIDTNNLSALMNLHALSKRENSPELPAIETELADTLKRLNVGMRIWSLAQVFGYVRTPEGYAQRGWAWAMSGKPNLAAEDMRRAVAMGGENLSIQMALGGIYMAQDMPAEGEKTYIDVLSKHPDSIPALLGLARVAMQRGDFVAAESYLDRLEELHASKTAIQLERAIIQALSGQAEAARDLLKEVVRERKDDARAWAALAVVATSLNDEDSLQQAMDRLDKVRLVSPGVRLALAQMAMARGDRASARRHLDQVLRQQPGHMRALEDMLRLEVYEVRRDAAEKRIEAILSLDPRNALANFVLGTLQVYNEDFALAESSFRKSIETTRSPETVNSLAWVLYRRGAYAEALALAKESLDLNDRSGAAWDTYGAVLMAVEKYDEAEQALQKALALAPNTAEILLHMAQLYEKKGLLKESLRISDGLLARPAELSRESYDTLRDLVRRLRMST